MTNVTFIDTAVAVAGIIQFPLVPYTNGAYVSPAASGVARGPTLSPVPRVSINRHGVIGTNTELAPGAADAVNIPPAPIDTATAAPSAAHRERCDDEEPGMIPEAVTVPSRARRDLFDERLIATGDTAR